MPKARILVVEPHAGIANYIREALELEPEGYEVVFSVTGAEALACLASERFDLAIVADELPDQSFNEAIVALRQAQSPPPEIFFMLSRQTQERVGNGSREIDALFTPDSQPDRFIIQPFNRDELRGIVDHWSKQRERRERQEQ